MATWVRTGNTLTGAADSVVTGTIELGNATAPADFDPDGVTSVRIQFTEEYASGTFDDDVYTANQWGLLTLDGAGATLADTGDQTNQTINDATDSFAVDQTDSTIPTGYSTAQWQGAELNPGSTNWIDYTKNAKGDGVACRVTSITVTITYTPAAGTVDQDSYRFYASGTESGSTALGRATNGPIAYDVATAFQCRFLLQVASASVDVQPKIQYRKYTAGTATPGSWTDITTSTAGIKAVAAGLTNNGDTTSRIGTPGDFVAGDQITDGAADSATTVAAGKETEFVFGLELVDDTTFDGHSMIELRVIDVTTGAYATETTFPHLAKTETTGNEDFTNGNSSQGAEIAQADIIPDVISKWGTSPSFAYDSDPARGSWAGYAQNPSDGGFQLWYDHAGPIFAARLVATFNGSAPTHDYELFRLRGFGELSSGIVLQIRVNATTRTMYVRDNTGSTLATFTNALPTTGWFSVNVVVEAESRQGADDLKWWVGLDVDVDSGSGYTEEEQGTGAQGDWLFEDSHWFSGSGGTAYAISVDDLEYSTEDPGAPPSSSTTLSGTLHTTSITKYAGTAALEETLVGTLHTSTPTYYAGTAALAITLSGSAVHTTTISHDAGTLYSTNYITGVAEHTTTPTYYSGAVPYDVAITGSALHTATPTYYVGAATQASPLIGTAVHTATPTYSVGAISLSLSITGTAEHTTTITHPSGVVQLEETLVGSALHTATPNYYTGTVSLQTTVGGVAAHTASPATFAGSVALEITLSGTAAHSVSHAFYVGSVASEQIVTGTAVHTVTPTYNAGIVGNEITLSGSAAHTVTPSYSVGTVAAQLSLTGTAAHTTSPTYYTGVVGVGGQLTGVAVHTTTNAFYAGVVYSTNYITGAAVHTTTVTHSSGVLGAELFLTGPAAHVSTITYNTGAIAFTTPISGIAAHTTQMSYYVGSLVPEATLVFADVTFKWAVEVVSLPDHPNWDTLEPPDANPPTYVPNVKAR